MDNLSTSNRKAFAGLYGLSPMSPGRNCKTGSDSIWSQNSNYLTTGLCVSLGVWRYAIFSLPQCFNSSITEVVGRVHIYGK